MGAYQRGEQQHFNRVEGENAASIKATKGLLKGFSFPEGVVLPHVVAALKTWITSNFPTQTAPEHDCKRAIGQSVDDQEFDRATECPIVADCLIIAPVSLACINFAPRHPRVVVFPTLAILACSFVFFSQGHVFHWAFWPKNGIEVACRWRRQKHCN